MSGVSLQGISKLFSQVRALDDVSLDIAPGELVALLGPSGCGKTTLLRCIAGLEQPDAGRILLGGADVTSVPPQKRSIGMVFQSYALFPNMSLRDNIGFPLKVRKASPFAIRRRTDDLLELVGLTDQADRYPHHVSGGQQQRAALARALAPEPELLLLDEPLSALDAHVRTRLRDEIRRIQHQVRITAVYVTHDQSEAMAIADRVVVMHRGHIEQVAPPEMLYENPATTFSASFVGNRNAIDLPVVDGEVRLGSLFRLPAPQESAQATVYFRTDDVVLVDDGQFCRVESKVFLGSASRLNLLIDTGGVVVRIAADFPSRQVAGIRAGMDLAIAIDPATCRVFAAVAHE